MRAYRGLVVGTVVVVVGCRQLLGIDDPTHQGPPGDVDAPSCFGADFADGGLIKVCLQPTMGSVVINQDINTDTAPQCATVVPPVGHEVCVIEAVDITISGPVTVSGQRPLVMIASHELHVATGATLDASSKLGGRLGAASNDSSCTTVASGGPGSAGGPGGSFGGSGGHGGGNSVNPQPPVMIEFVRGGCQGQVGAGGGQLSLSGPSGGAVYLIAGDTIQVDGTILSCGGGGRGASGSNGGAGGGTGGLIGLDAPMITGSGTIIAAGGGGGEGGGDIAGSGADGQDSPGKLGQIAKGGASQPDGGNGGNGGGFGSGATDGGSGSGSGSNIGGGGGGGGAVGIIWVRGTLTVTNVSPPKSP